MTPALFADHIVFVLLFGAIVGVEHMWSQRRSDAWRARWLAELQQIKKNWGIIAPSFEQTRDTVERHEREIETLKRKVSALEGEHK